jgi:hypothetical protein
MKTLQASPRKKTALVSAFAVVLGGSLPASPAAADIYTFSFGPGVSNPIDIAHPRASEALFTMLDPVGNPLANTAYPYYGDPTWGYGFRTQLTGTLTFDTVELSGSAFIQPFQFFGAMLPATLRDLTFQDAGIDPATGHTLVLANMLLDWNVNLAIPVALVWDVDGLLSAVAGGLNVGDAVSGGTLPASESVLKSRYPIGPSPVASTTWDATNTCVVNCSGVNPSGSLPLSADTIGGDPMYAGPFPGFNLNIDLTSLHVVSIVHDDRPAFSVATVIPGGNQQECATTAGANVTMNAVVRIDPPLEVGSLTWKLDGQAVAVGESVEVFVPLGTHTVETILESTAGDVTSSSGLLTIEDTIAPEIQAAFTTRRSGRTTTELSGPGRKRATVSINVQDICDPSPTSNATAGLPVVNDDSVITQSTPGQSDVQLLLETHSDSIELSVTAADASGNISNKKTTLRVIP